MEYRNGPARWSLAIDTSRLLSSGVSPYRPWQWRIDSEPVFLCRSFWLSVNGYLQFLSGVRLYFCAGSK
jgi:hypothetical protein